MRERKREREKLCAFVRACVSSNGLPRTAPAAAICMQTLVSCKIYADSNIIRKFYLHIFEMVLDENMQKKFFYFKKDLDRIVSLSQEYDILRTNVC